MISCKEIAVLSQLHIDGDLPEELEVQVERHLLQCRECSFQLRSLEQTTDLLKEAFPPELSSSSYRERALARLQENLSDVLAQPLPEEQSQWALPFLRDRSA